MFTNRYGYTPETWEDFLPEAGFEDVGVIEIDAPTPGHIDALLARAVLN
ncbi:hypothetical protein ACFCXA_03440 [Streptomyces virginiae]